VTPQKVFATIGGEAEFHCRFGSEMLWKFNWNNLPSNVGLSKTYVMNDTLMIHSISKLNSGEYICWVLEEENLFYQDFGILVVKGISLPYCKYLTLQGL